MTYLKHLGAWLRRGGWIAVLDIVCVCALLVTFAYFHHGRVLNQTGSHLVSCRSGGTYKLDSDFSRAFDEGDAGYFSFENRFFNDEPQLSINGDTTYYQDSGSDIAVTRYTIATGSVQVADIYISDIARLQTALANNTYGKGQRDDPAAIAADAAFYITGDNYSERDGGVIMRNGVLYSEEVDRDICVLNWDGTMDLYRQSEYSLQRIMENGAYQIWSFGPILMEDGEPATEFITDMTAPCRRAAIGYYEPGHYCFVIMDGDVTLEALAQTMDILGCESAYGLYGGRLAEMGLAGEIMSTPQEADRECSDIIMITN